MSLNKAHDLKYHFWPISNCFLCSASTQSTGTKNLYHILQLHYFKLKLMPQKQRPNWPLYVSINNRVNIQFPEEDIYVPRSSNNFKDLNIYFTNEKFTTLMKDVRYFSKLETDRMFSNILTFCVKLLCRCAYLFLSFSKCFNHCVLRVVPLYLFLSALTENCYSHLQIWTLKKKVLLRKKS